MLNVVQCLFEMGNITATSFGSSQPHPSLCSIFHPGLHFFSTSLFLPWISHKLSRNLLFPEFQLRALQAKATSSYTEYCVTRSGSSGPTISWLQLFLNAGAGFSGLQQSSLCLSRDKEWIIHLFVYLDLSVGDLCSEDAMNSEKSFI